MIAELTRDWLEDRFADRRLPPAYPTQPQTTGSERGDHNLNPGLEPMQPLKQAAVLVPLVDHPTGMTMLFTERTAHLANHAGQVSFPGGVSSRATAARWRRRFGKRRRKSGSIGAA